MQNKQEMKPQLLAKLCYVRKRLFQTRTMHEHSSESSGYVKFKFKSSTPVHMFTIYQKKMQMKYQRTFHFLLFLIQYYCIIQQGPAYNVTLYIK